MIKTLQERLDEIQKLLDQVKEKMDDMRKSEPQHVWPTYPQRPTPTPWPERLPDDNYNVFRCPRCRIEFKGVFGYVCSDPDCPMQPKITY